MLIKTRVIAEVGKRAHLAGWSAGCGVRGAESGAL